MKTRLVTLTVGYFSEEAGAGRGGAQADEASCYLSARIHVLGLCCHTELKVSIYGGLRHAAHCSSMLVRPVS